MGSMGRTVGIGFRHFMPAALLVKGSMAATTTGSLAQEGGQCTCMLPPADIALGSGDSDPASD
jgi:hypothetical protein